MRFALAPLLLLALVSGCRTTVKARPLPKLSDVYVPRDGECHVHDYPEAADIPEGAKNLGKVSVDRQGSDEETYLALRSAICAAGGDALSSLHWVFELGQVQGEPHSLEANAWLLGSAP